MLVIRLSRMGKKKRPTYRVVVQEKGRDPWGQSVEIIGNYNPQSKPKTFVVKEDRVKYWISQGAQASPTVHNLLLEAKIIDGQKIKNTTKDRQNAAKSAAEKAKKAAEETKVSEEAMTEEKPSEEPVTEHVAEENKGEDKKEEVAE